METVIGNIAGKVHRTHLNGREYIVAPTVMIVPGVLNGNEGPLLYPADELSKNPSRWDGIPLVLNHPVKDGKNVSARNPEVLMTHGLGMVMGTKFQDSLKAMAWFDVENTTKVAPWIIEKLTKGEPIEVSTGLSAIKEETSGSYLGKPFVGTARDYQPDHLAVLSNEKGACSIKDGCGVIVNAKLSHDELYTKLCSLLSEKFGTHEEYGFSNAYPVAVYDKQVVYRNEDKLYQDGYKTDLRTGTVQLNGEPVEVQRIITYKPVAESKDTTNSEGQNMDRTAAITYLTTNCECWKGKLDTLNKMDDDTISILHKQAQKEHNAALVVRAAEEGFKTLFTDTQPTPELVANAIKDKLKPATAETKPTQTETKPTGQTMQQWLESMPAEARQVWNNAVEIERKERTDLINQILANAGPEQKAAATPMLQTKSLQELRTIASLVKPSQPAQVSNQETVMMPSWLLSAGTVETTNSQNNSSDDLLPLPQMDWTSK